jgi:phosphoglycolate phosphatase
MICAGCGSDGRTRLLGLILALRHLLGRGMPCLHIEPEPALAPRLHQMLGDGYEPVDIDPDRFPFAPNIRRLDLVADAAHLPSATYDLICIRT